MSRATLILGALRLIREISLVSDFLDLVELCLEPVDVLLLVPEQLRKQIAALTARLHTSPNPRRRKIPRRQLVTKIRDDAAKRILSRKKAQKAQKEPELKINYFVLFVPFAANY